MKDEYLWLFVSEADVEQAREEEASPFPDPPDSSVSCPTAQALKRCHFVDPETVSVGIVTAYFTEPQGYKMRLILPDSLREQIYRWDQINDFRPGWYRLEVTGGDR